MPSDAVLEAVLTHVAKEGQEGVRAKDERRAEGGLREERQKQDRGGDRGKCRMCEQMKGWIDGGGGGVEVFLSLYLWGTVNQRQIR